MGKCTYGLYKMSPSSKTGVDVESLCLMNLGKERFDDISRNYKELYLVYEVFGLNAELIRTFNRFKHCIEMLDSGNLFQKEKEIRISLNSFLETAFRVKSHFLEHIKLICGEDVGKKFDESCQEFYKSNISAPLINTCNNLVKHQQDLPLSISDGLDSEGNPQTTLLLNPEIILQRPSGKKLNKQVRKLFESHSKIEVYPYVLEFYNFLSELIQNYIVRELLSTKRVDACFKLLDLFVSKINANTPVLTLTKLQLDGDDNAENLFIELAVLCNIMSVFLNTRHDFLGSYWGEGIAEQYFKFIPGPVNQIDPDTLAEQKTVMYKNTKYVYYKERPCLDGNTNDYIYQFAPCKEIYQDNFEHLDILWRYFCALIDGVKLLNRADCCKDDD